MTLRPRDRAVLAVVLFLALVGAYYKLALAPERQEATKLSASIAGQRQALATAQSNYAQGRAAEASLRSDAVEWAALRRAVPAQSDIPALLRTLQRNADAVGVQLQSIQLSGASGSSSTAGSPSTPGSSAAATAAGANAVPVQLTFAGGYAALDKLVRRLDGMVELRGGKVHSSGPLLSIGTVSLSKSPQLTVQLSATIYQLQAPPATTSATTGG